MLDQLRAAHVTATFCLVGSQVRAHPELVARIVREGHQLCNHSWRHDLDLGRRPVADIRADLVRTNKAIQRGGTGRQGPYYRQPGGRWTARGGGGGPQLGMRLAALERRPAGLGQADREDDHRSGSAPRPGPAPIVLMHDGGGDRRATLAACPHLIADLKRRYGIARLR